MTILAPFKALTVRFPQLLNGTAHSAVADEDIYSLIKILLLSVAVDDAFYREKYPDVSAAIDAGDYESPRDHFIRHGYFEGRIPSRLSIDQDWYIKNYDDVLLGIENGDIVSAEDHFNLHGYQEGRLPAKP